MNWINNAINGIGSGLYWVVKKWFPAEAKKLGAIVFKGAIQKSLSAIIVTISVAFWGAFVTFVVSVYNEFSDFMSLITNPASSVAGAGSEYLSCFFHLLNVSGFSAGLNSAFAFTIMVLLFSFTLFIYTFVKNTLKHISDELHKVSSASKD